jgi:hypothetical protein
MIQSVIGTSFINEKILVLTFDDINNVTNFSNFSGDAYSLEDWNQFFDLPQYGTPFTSVEVNGNQVSLIDGGNIIMRESLFDGSDSLIEVDDSFGCVIELRYNVFGDDEHSGSYNLVSVNFPNVTVAGEYCFSNCGSLTTINLSKLTTAGDGCFYSCSSLTTINLPRLTTADQNCFEDCQSLTTINLPRLTNLGGTPGDNRVFSNISQNNIVATFNSVLLTNNGGGIDGDIQYLGIFNSLTINSQSYAPFTGYDGNLEIEFNDIENADILVGDSSNVEDWNTFFDLPGWSTPFTNVSIDSHTVILEGGKNILINKNFENNSNIFSIIDQGCICYIENNCFKFCDSLTIIDFPELITVGSGCFQSCYSLTTIDLPALTTAGDYCFYSCNSLTTIDLPNLTTAGSSCFGNSAFTTVNLPELTTTGGYCFAGCFDLVNISLPELTTAAGSCFQSCNSLTTVDLPALTTAGAQCFLECALTTINLPLCTNLGGSVSNNSVFSGITKNTITLTIPATLMTCNGGKPDGDIQILQDSNQLTIITT